jgi:4a-hydroxytetrahydrobiopterin dehydratase
MDEKPQKLSEKEVQDGLANISGWVRHVDHIEKDYKVKDFAAALDFVNRIGAEAEAMDHHPDILMHDWNQVKIMLSTHSAGGITQNDMKLAKKIEGMT